MLTLDNSVSLEQEAVPLRRLSAGLSMAYDALGEHCPRYSQREVELMMEKKEEEMRAAHDAQVRHVICAPPPPVVWMAGRMNGL